MRAVCGSMGRLAAWAVVVGLAGIGSAQTVSIRAANDPTITQLRLAALGFMEKGQWASAKAGVDQLLANDPNDALGLELRRLIQSYQKVEQIRREQREGAYRESLGKIEQFVAKGTWEEALSEATRAADLAASKAELARQEWFNKLTENCTRAAENHRAKGEWLKATTVYSQMAALFEKEDNPYRQSARKTARYARLEAVYRDKDEAAKQIAGVDENMMAAALEQVRRFYVREPDYKKMTINAAEFLLALTETPSLVKAFPALAPGEGRDKLRRELLALRDQVSKPEQMNLQELAQAYLKAKRANLESVKLPEGVIIREFLDGATEPLDTFSTMVWPADKGEFEKQMSGEFFGVGIQISLEDGQLTVVSPLEDTPAYRAGIQAGDVIVAIDGESTQGITLNQAVQKITGPADTPVVLSIKRAGLAEPKDFRLLRDRIRILTVKGYRRDKAGQWEYVIDPDYRIGYVRVTNYMKRTVEELEQALDALTTQGVRGLVIDLRFDPGGLLNQAVEMSDLFLEEGVIVSTEGRAVRRTEERAHAGGSNTAWPLVVLVNEYSASAAEIVSGALRDHERAIIVGERTYGKGSVQNVIPVGAEKLNLTEAKDAPAYLKLTTAYYYLPSGRSIHRHEDSQAWGVEPNVTVKVTRDEMQDILDLRRESDVVHRPGEATATQPASSPATQPQRVRIDPQLESAMMVLRAELLRKKL